MSYVISLELNFQAKVYNLQLYYKSLTKVKPVHFAKFFRTAFLQGTSWISGRLFLSSFFYLSRRLVIYWFYRTIKIEWSRMKYLWYDMRVLKKKYKALIFFWSFSYLIFLYHLLRNKVANKIFTLHMCFARFGQISDDYKSHKENSRSRWNCAAHYQQLILRDDERNNCSHNF